MSELTPLPFASLVSRMLRELERKDSIFDLPRRAFFTGSPEKDFSVKHHGRDAASPLGPAAGPHSQLAQNIVLAWLGGSRIMELKTVQILDELKIPRPCIDMANVGYNVEWSQELKLEQSLDEYVKASMLIDILRASGRLDLAEGFEATVFDMSVGYDLKGIRSDRVQAFMRGLMDAGSHVERLRGEIPEEFKRFRDVEFRTKLSNTLTLSTFHGCPPGEIEGIIDYLLKAMRLHCVAKLNPTLLGPEKLRRLMGEVMGYQDIETPDSAFEKDARWEQAAGFCERLSKTAAAAGLGFGVKFSNTLIVKNHRDFFPKNESEMYLSGPPLHVLAMNLVRRFRRHFGDRIPVSFSAGIDRSNFPDAVALGLVPVTVCTDMLKPGGYARQAGYFEELVKRMDAAAAADVPEFILEAYGQADAALKKAGLREAPARGSQEHARWVSEAKLLNSEIYVEKVTNDPRYRAAKNAAVPKKVGSALSLFNCLTCDKCVPVCPNDANFALSPPKGDIPIEKLVFRNGRFDRLAGGTLKLAKKHQLANFADFCNECGNCDIFCPEDGGPYRVKPRFFGSLDSWRGAKDRDGFFVGPGGAVVHGRFEVREYLLKFEGDRAAFSGDGFEVRFSKADPAGTAEGKAEVEVDLTLFHIMDRLARAVLSDQDVNYINAQERERVKT